ncbi:sulfotransferase (plasmid) [Novosphingobium sp. BL-8H]|uniref:sulfotransferase family protein n=1 Tax=Novosphingobium sp. BL-8H TaxID=3127640 RepID=UPI003757F7A4
MNVQENVSVFVCGAQKGGTTSLYAHFLEHPDLQDPNEKEIHFFDDETVDWHDPCYDLLHARFDGPAGARLRYDITPIYQFWPNALSRIAEYNPDAKLIFLFRDPYERALSHWAMEFARRAENLDFRRAIREGRNRLSDLPRNAPAWREYSYLERGLYGEQIEKALQLFPADQMLFLRSEDLRDDHVTTLKSIEEFLGISPFPDTGPKREHRRYATPETSGAGPDDLALIARFVALDLEKFSQLSGLDISGWPTRNAMGTTRAPVIEMALSA